MALIAHYPLNGDTLDYSGNGNHATNHGAEVDDEGKIGKCYEFTGASMSTSIPYSTYDPSKTSSTMSCWVYIKNLDEFIKTIKYTTEPHLRNNAQEALMGYNSYGGLGVFLSLRKGQKIPVITTRYRTPKGSRGVSYNNVEIEKWKHIVSVVDGTRLRLYIDGEFTTETIIESVLDKAPRGDNFSISRPMVYAGNGPAVNFPCKINDVRVYDHALSTKEIKELAKAKILHYTFDDFQEPTENLLDAPHHGGGNHGSHQSFTWSVNQPVMAGEEYTISADFLRNGIHNGRIYCMFSLRDEDGVQIPGNVGLVPGWSATEREALYYYFNRNIRDASAKEWKRYTLPTIKIPEGYDRGEIAWIRFTIATNPTDEKLTTEFKNCQLEKKPHATPFTPTSREGIVKDISGHKNHATLDLAATPQWTSDSKIGGGAYEFDGVGNFIRTPTIYSTDQLCVSMWVFPLSTNTVENILWGHNSNKVILQRNLDNTVSWYAQTSSGSRDYISTVNTLNQDRWNHLVWRYDGSSVTMFINGVEEDSHSFSGRVVAAPINLGTNYNARSRFFTGTIDDVRIYATALSDDDIKELYQTRASLDDEGNLSVSGEVEITSINGCPPFSQWSLSGGAYVENGMLVLPNRGARATSPYIFIGRDNNWTFSADYYSNEERVDRPGQGGYLQGSSYFDRDKKSTLNNRDWASNGNASVYPVKKWSRKQWSSVGGREVEYLRMNIRNSSTYTAEEYRVKNPMVTINKIWQDFYPYNSRFFDEKLPEYQVGDKGVMRINNIREVGLPIRYIRDYVNGSTANSANHWIEIQAYDSNDINVALGMVAYYNNDKNRKCPDLVDGDISTSQWTLPNMSGGSYRTVDLGEVTIVDYLKIWHYHGDGRAYHDTKTEVSADGDNWITVFDSAVEGEYEETSDGHTIILKPDKMSIDDKGNLFVSEIKEVF